jgi:hypothetical protein
MNNSSYLSGTGRYNDNGTARILPEDIMLAVLVLGALLAQLAHKDELCLHIVLEGIILAVDNLQEEISIAV